MRVVRGEAVILTTSELLMGLTVTKLSCVRGERQVFRDLSFRVVPGEMLTLVGPNGSGKSSLLRQLAGLLEVTDGEINLDGASEDQTIADVVLYAGHLDAIKAPLSVSENSMVFLASKWRMPLRLSVLGILDICQLEFCQRVKSAGWACRGWRSLTDRSGCLMNRPCRLIQQALRRWAT